MSNSRLSDIKAVRATCPTGNITWGAGLQGAMPFPTPPPKPHVPHICVGGYPPCYPSPPPQPTPCCTTCPGSCSPTSLNHVWTDILPLHGILPHLQLSEGSPVAPRCMASWTASTLALWAVLAYPLVHGYEAKEGRGSPEIPQH